MFSTRALAGIASVGGVFVIGSSYYFKTRIQEGLKTSEYCKESLGILRAHRGEKILRW